MISVKWKRTFSMGKGKFWVEVEHGGALREILQV